MKPCPNCNREIEELYSRCYKCNEKRNSQLTSNGNAHRCPKLLADGRQCEFRAPHAGKCGTFKPQSL